VKVRILVWNFFKRRYAAAGATRHARAYFLMKLASRPLKPNLKTAKNSAARPETGVLCRPEAHPDRHYHPRHSHKSLAGAPGLLDTVKGAEGDRVLVGAGTGKKCVWNG
jgi:hypothetical protein